MVYCCSITLALGDFTIMDTLVLIDDIGFRMQYWEENRVWTI